jgi:hypothetical protein
VARGHVECASLFGPASRPLVLDGVTTGGDVVDLSRDTASGAETVLLRLPQFWHWPSAGAFADEVELLVLSGGLRLGSVELRAGDYAVYRAGAVLDGLDSRDGAEVLWMSAGPLRYVAATRAADATPLLLGPIAIAAQPWLPSPDFEGRTAAEAGTGLGVRFLREDPVTGAYTLMTRHAPGWFDPRLESHDTWEELVLLDGDFLMGNTGVVTTGSYIFRPGLRPHGPQVTRTGATWFCRGERRIDFQFQSPGWSAERARAYLAAAPGTFPDPPRRWRDIL